MPEQNEWGLPLIAESYRRRLVGAAAGAVLGLLVEWGVLHGTTADSELVRVLLDGLTGFLMLAGYGLTHKWLKRRNYTPPSQEHLISKPGGWVTCWCGSIHVTVDPATMKLP